MPLGMLGKYERLDVLGHGATGIVYLAKDTYLGKQVALKEIAAQGDEKSRFLEEARVLDRLRHPNIVRVNSVDEIDGKVVIDMEYIRGRNLQDVLRQTPQLPIPDAVRITIQICNALSFAHSRHTVHRDIKPANIILTDAGDVKLVDFGLAEVLGTHSFAGGGGTYAYMAPEDFREGDQSDRQSDIWACGIVLFEMLAGHRPFRVQKTKDPFAWKRAIDDDPLPSIESLRAGAPPEIDHILSLALARDKQDRYQDAGDMERDLRALKVCSVPAAPPEEGGGLDLSDLSDLSDTTDNSKRPHDLALLPNFPPVYEIDPFLALAPGHWPEARAALTNGELSRWLTEIGETLLADVADELVNEDGRDDDEKLRDFLYRAGFETTEEARIVYEQGAAHLRSGRFDEAENLLRRATKLNPGQPESFTLLAEALQAKGDVAGAALVLAEGAKYHPGKRNIARQHIALRDSEVTLSADEIDFGVLRHGEVRSQKLTLNHPGKGGLKGRVISSPGWISVEPATFTARRRQILTFTANTSQVWKVPSACSESVVLETSGGRHEITVAANVIPSRRSFPEIARWYIALLICCVLPIIAGLVSPALSHHFGARHLWQPGMVASGLLCGGLFVVCVAADIEWLLRFVPLAILGLDMAGAAGLAQSLGDPGSRVARLALVETSAPIILLLVALVYAMMRSPQRFGRWPIWGWAIGLAGVLSAYLLLCI